MSYPATNMLMVFCEGSHDVVYVREIIKHCFGFKKVTWKFKDYPSPLNNLFPKRIKDHAAGDTQTFIDEAFSWQTNHPTAAQAVAEEAKRNKAVFTAIGQRETLGGSMAVVLNQKELIAVDTWKQDKHVLRFARFVAKFAKLEFEQCAPSSVP